MKTRWLFMAILIATVILSGCAGASEASQPTAPAALRDVSLGIGYVPNVQFTPLYVAQQKGFFAEEGLNVSIEYGFENDFVALAAQGDRDFAIASGDQVILARAQSLPVTYVMKWYQRFPVALMLGPGHNISSPAELAGLKIGLPGLYGASFVGWKALVYGAGINESTVDVEEIGFTQVAAVQQGAVDGAIVYIANEPIQLRDQGLDVSVFEVSDYIDLVSNGLVVSEKLVQSEPEVVRKMVQGTLRGLQYTIEHPDEAFEISRKVIPEMTDDDARIQRQVLDASIELWRTDQPGVSSPQAWQDSVDFMRATGLLENDIDVSRLFDNQFAETKQ